MKLLHIKNSTTKQYLNLRPWVIVLYLSMNLNSSLLSCYGDTFLTTETVKMSKENVVWCTSFACIERADLSHFPSVVKQLLCPLVRSWHS